MDRDTNNNSDYFDEVFFRYLPPPHHILVLSPQMKEDNPSFTNAEVSKECQARWKALPADQKEVYLAQERSDKARYEREMKGYRQRKGEVAEDEEESGGRSEDD